MKLHKPPIFDKEAIKDKKVEIGLKLLDEKIEHTLPHEIPGLRTKVLQAIALGIALELKKGKQVWTVDTILEDINKVPPWNTYVKLGIGEQDIRDIAKRELNNRREVGHETQH